MRARFAYVVFLSLVGLGCGDELGPCADKNAGRDTVLVNGVVMYGGQAIVNKSCAGGRCHSSSAQGAARSGAPAGLDFDLVPVAQEDAEGAGERNGHGIVQLSEAQVVGLRDRQRTVYDERHNIWRQVSLGLMPPSGDSFSIFRELKTIFDTSSTKPCAKGQAYHTLHSVPSHEVLRNWLACGSPIVESYGAAVEGPGVGGIAGYQYPVCEDVASPSDGGVASGPSLETLLTGPLSSCASCHPSQSGPDFSTLMGAQAAVESRREVCAGKPYVTKGDPQQSFLYEILSTSTPGCGHQRMPLGGAALPARQLMQIEAWIRAGAPIRDSNVK